MRRIGRWVWESGGGLLQESEGTAATGEINDCRPSLTTFPINPLLTFTVESRSGALKATAITVITLFFSENNLIQYVNRW